MKQDKIEVFTCEQGSDEWFAARRGIPTASMFATVMASGKGGSESKTRRKYMLQLAGEILTEEPMWSFSNEHMNRGKEMEDAVRKQYAFQTDADLERIGFLRHGKKGCSPDSLIGKKRMLEVKTMLPDLLIDIHLRGEFPPGHKAQCQGNLWVAKREEIDIAIGYIPPPPMKSMPLYVQPIRRDEPYIAAMAKAVDEFNQELEYVVAQMRRFG